MAGRVTMLPFSNLYERYHFVQGTSPQRISMFQNGSHLSCNLTPVTDTMQPLPYLPYSLPRPSLSLSLPHPHPDPTPPDLGLHTKTSPSIFNHGDISITKENISQ